MDVQVLWTGRCCNPGFYRKSRLYCEHIAGKLQKPDHNQETKTDENTRSNVMLSSVVSGVYSKLQRVICCVCLCVCFRYWTRWWWTEDPPPISPMLTSSWMDTSLPQCREMVSERIIFFHAQWSEKNVNTWMESVQFALCRQQCQRVLMYKSDQCCMSIWWLSLHFPLQDLVVFKTPWVKSEWQPKQFSAWTGAKFSLCTFGWHTPPSKQWDFYQKFLDVYSVYAKYKRKSNQKTVY